VERLLEAGADVRRLSGALTKPLRPLWISQVGAGGTMEWEWGSAAAAAAVAVAAPPAPAACEGTVAPPPPPPLPPPRLATLTTQRPAGPRPLPLCPFQQHQASVIWTNCVAQPEELPFTPVILVSASHPHQYQRLTARAPGREPASPTSRRAAGGRAPASGAPPAAQLPPSCRPTWNAAYSATTFSWLRDACSATSRKIWCW
jgi:hypothetical protein